jgi:hypothetical protein
LWLALRYPPTDHPIFRQGTRADTKAKLTWLLWLIALILAPILILPGLLLAGTTYSLLWAIQISNYLTQTRSHKDYDLLWFFHAGNLESTGCSVQAIYTEAERLHGYMGSASGAHV